MLAYVAIYICDVYFTKCSINISNLSMYAYNYGSLKVYIRSKE